MSSRFLKMKVIFSEDLSPDVLIHLLKNYL